jgi:hypothetical protein
LDEAEANRLALQDMGLSQEQYNALIAESSEDNAANLINSSNTGA